MIADRDTPYSAQMAASRERQLARGVRPKGLGQLLTWFLQEWNHEIPTRTHSRGVWRATVRSDEHPPKEHVGGSLLGAPADAVRWRRYIEERANQRNEDGHYIFPMHATLGRIAGRGEYSDRAYMALFLAAIAAAAGDWQGVAYRSGIPPQIAATYLGCALNRAWNEWSPQ